MRAAVRPRPATDDAVLHRLAARHGEYLLALAQRRIPGDLRVKAPPEDLVQETLIRACRHVARLRTWSEPRQRAWLRRVLRNQIASAHRRFHRAACRSLFREGSLHSDLKLRAEQTAAPPHRGVELTELLELLLDQLPPRQRCVVRQRHWENRSFAEIGQELSVSPEAARKLWERSLLRLRQTLKLHDGG